jgi:DNA-binding transcriptional ArsR family regulator
MTDLLSEKFSALGDPTRRAILARLAEGSATLTELAAPFEMSIPAVAKHLRVLEKARLVRSTQEGRRRPVVIEAGALQEIADWVEWYRKFWGNNLQRLDRYLARSVKGKRRAK